MKKLIATVVAAAAVALATQAPAALVALQSSSRAVGF